ncbi:CRIB DOMAIN-CONTAINING PROTEIN RIC8 [Salix koriyanagi]|uniref:CRIB DOMAIN-CONTAINING PROTEIN RIC8 n=1 Tax=Salix koriyanagi TaxID=2511006 RepID=A0A9Q0WLK7_9ROSI|nr:CRIB DOMAIN-CONTAINING PROTEIN RIC8 [Salix koriyanagi]
MTTKVKGLLRGLRYISQIFDEKEQEMQIGFPTDVKHVAHIGCDGPSATNAPTWMNEFNSPPELPCGTSNSKEEVKSLSTDPHSEDTIQTEKPKHRSRRSSGSGSSLLNSPDRRSAADSSRNSRHQASSSTGSPLNSPRGTDAPKSSRRHRSSNKSMDSPKGESSSGTSRISRRQKNSSLDAESPTHEQPSIPKHSRGRKSRGSPGSGPSKSKEKKSSKEAAPFSDPGSGGSESINGRTNPASQLSSVLEAREEEG